MQRIFVTLIAALFGRRWRELATRMALGAGHRFVSFKQWEVRTRTMIDLHHIFAFHFDRARLKMAFEALAVFKLLIVHNFVLMATGAFSAWPKFFKLRWTLASMTGPTTDLGMFARQRKIAVLGMIKYRWLPIHRWMTNAALGRFAELAEAIAVLVVFGVALLAGATWLGFAHRFGVTFVALHFIVSLAQIKFGPLIMVEVLLFQGFEGRRVTQLAASFPEQMIIMWRVVTTGIATGVRFGKWQIEFALGMALRTRHVFV